MDVGWAAVKGVQGWAGLKITICGPPLGPGGLW